MSFFQIVYGLLFIVVSSPVLGYARHLHDKEQNRLGALAVVFLIVLIGVGITQIEQ